jgi:predicted nucleotidyltransferase
MKTNNFTDKEIFKQIREHKDVLKKYGVKRIGLFGSYIKGEQKKNSDIDFLVEFAKPDFNNFMHLCFYLEHLFSRRVEILTPDGVRSIRIKEIAEEIKRSVVYV